MPELQFSNANIVMATNELTGRQIVWDYDADVFGRGWSFPEALEDLARKYPDDYRQK